MTRRDLLALLLVTGCGGAPGRGDAGSAVAAAPALALEPVSDLVTGAGLSWLLEARLVEVFASPALIPALALVLPAGRLDAFSRRHGGVDLRSVRELVLAGYPDATLGVARTILDPARVEGAFAARAVAVEGRAVEGSGGSIVRTWGTVGASRQQIAIFGREAVGLEQGRFGPLRVAEYFAQGKLRRARPALRAEPLASVAARLGPAPLRAFAPGPFAGAVGRGLGGLLAGATAVGATATPVDRDPDGALAVRAVIEGAWGADAPAAAERLRAAFDVLANDPLGRLLDLNRPLTGPEIAAQPDAVSLTITLDALRLARGLRDVTSATVDEIMRA